MDFFIFLLIIFFTLILFVFTYTVIKTILFLMTKYKYETRYLIIPSFLMISIFISVILAWYFTITKILNIDILSIYFNEFLNLDTSPNYDLKNVAILSIIYAIIGIILQAFSYFTVNINYRKLSGFFRNIFKKTFKIKEIDINENNNSLRLDNRPDRLSYSNAFISSLFTFSLLFFFVLVLLAIGNVISIKLI